MFSGLPAPLDNCPCGFAIHRVINAGLRPARIAYPQLPTRGLQIPEDTMYIPEDTMQIPEDTGHKDTKSADYKVVDSEIREGGRMYIIDVSMSFLSYSVFIFGESTLFINKMLNFETKLVD